MRKISEQEYELIREFVNSPENVYVAEDFSDHFAISEQISRIAESKAIAIARTMSRWDELVGDLIEAGPPGFFDGDESPKPWEYPKISREKVVIDDIDINFLNQFPPQAQSQVFMDTLYSANPETMRYIGPGISGALKAQKQGQEVGNWVQEIRFTRQGSPSNTFDPVTQKKIPLLGAVTKRKVNSPKDPTPNPNWGDYGSQKNRDRSKSNPENGVYAPFAWAIDKLGTPINAQRQVSKLKRGQVGADLNPPDPDDPDSYLPHTADTMQPYTTDPNDPDWQIPYTGQGAQQRPQPFSTQGYSPGDTSRSKSAHDNMTQFMRARSMYPNIFNNKRLDVLFKKSQQPGSNIDIPSEQVPFSRPVARRDNEGNYRQLKWVSDPNNPGKKIRERPDQRPYTPEEISSMIAHYDGLAKQGNQAAAQYAQRLRSIQASGGMVNRPAMIDMKRGGTSKVEDPESDPNAKKKKLKSTGEKTPVKAYVQKKSLDNLYSLAPAIARPMQISEDLAREYSSLAKQAEQKQQSLEDYLPKNYLWKSGGNSEDDEVFKQSFRKNFLYVAKDRTFASDKNKFEATRFNWAMLDKDNRVLFRYIPDNKTFNMPIHSPGVIEFRKSNNPRTYGGFDAAPANQGEADPPKSKEEYEKIMYGPEGEGRNQDPDPSSSTYTDPEDWKGWFAPTWDAASVGVANGINILNNRYQISGADQIKVEAEKEAIHHAAMDYIQRNLRNPKSWNFEVDGGQGMNWNPNYSKRMFRTLYASMKKMDQWATDPTNRKAMEEIDPGYAELLKQKPSEMDLASLRSFMGGVKQVAGEDPMFTVKMPTKYINSQLSPHEIDRPEGKQDGFSKLAVTPEALSDLIDEARHHYWRLASKDMAIKIWQAYFKRGDLGRHWTKGVSNDIGSSDDFGDEEKPRRKREVLTDEENDQMLGMTTRASDMIQGGNVDQGRALFHDFLKKKREEAELVRQYKGKWEQEARENPGNSNIAAQLAAAGIREDDLERQQESINKLMKHYTSKGLSEEEAELKTIQSFKDTYMAGLEEKARKPISNAENASLEDRVNAIAGAVDVNNPRAQEIGKGLANLNPNAVKEAENLEGDDELAVIYHTVKSFMEMDPRAPATREQISELISDLSGRYILDDLVGMLKQLLKKKAA